MVELFSRPGCGPCAGTEKFLKDNNISYVKKDVMADASAFDELQSMGYNSVPVVRNGNDHWNSLNLQKLRELI